jgi:hypothetical protein
MTDVLSTIFVMPRNPANSSVGCRVADLVPLRRAEARVYGEAAIDAMQPHEHPDDHTSARIYDLTNPVHLRMLADYIEKERW